MNWPTTSITRQITSAQGVDRSAPASPVREVALVDQSTRALPEADVEQLDGHGERVAHVDVEGPRRQRGRDERPRCTAPGEVQVENIRMISTTFCASRKRTLMPLKNRPSPTASMTMISDSEQDRADADEGRGPSDDEADQQEHPDLRQEVDERDDDGRDREELPRQIDLPDERPVRRRSTFVALPNPSLKRLISDDAREEVDREVRDVVMDAEDDPHHEVVDDELCGGLHVRPGPAEHGVAVARRRCPCGPGDGAGSGAGRRRECRGRGRARRIPRDRLLSHQRLSGRCAFSEDNADHAPSILSARSLTVRRTRQSRVAASSSAQPTRPRATGRGAVGGQPRQSPASAGAAGRSRPGDRAASVPRQWAAVGAAGGESARRQASSSGGGRRGGPAGARQLGAAGTRRRHRWRSPSGSRSTPAAASVSHRRRDAPPPMATMSRATSRAGTCRQRRGTSRTVRPAHEHPRESRLTGRSVARRTSRNPVGRRRSPRGTRRDGVDRPPAAKYVPFPHGYEERKRAALGVACDRRGGSPPIGRREPKSAAIAHDGR